VPAELIADFNRIGLADSALAAPQAGFGGVEAYPDNKRCAFLATVEFVERNGRTWVPAPGDPDETDLVIRGVAGGEVSEAEFRDRIGQRCG
jgi:hypothetical protein